MVMRYAAAAMALGGTRMGPSALLLIPLCVVAVILMDRRQHAMALLLCAASLAQVEAGRNGFDDPEADPFADLEAFLQNDRTDGEEFGEDGIPDEDWQGHGEGAGHEQHHSSDGEPPWAGHQPLTPEAGPTEPEDANDSEIQTSTASPSAW